MTGFAAVSAPLALFDWLVTAPQCESAVPFGGVEEITGAPDTNLMVEAWRRTGAASGHRDGCIDAHSGMAEIIQK